LQKMRKLIGYSTAHSSQFYFSRGEKSKEQDQETKGRPLRLSPHVARSM
jgi:hypothetical protein